MKFSKKLNKLKDKLTDAYDIYFVKYKKLYMLSIYSTTYNLNDAKKFFTRQDAQDFINEIKRWNLYKKEIRHLRICSKKMYK